MFGIDSATVQCELSTFRDWKGLPYGLEKQCAWKMSAALHSQKTLRLCSTTSWGKFQREPSRCNPI